MNDENSLRVVYYCMAGAFATDRSFYDCYRSTHGSSSYPEPLIFATGAALFQAAMPSSACSHVNTPGTLGLRTVHDDEGRRHFEVAKNAHLILDDPSSLPVMSAINSAVRICVELARPR